MCIKCSWIFLFIIYSFFDLAAIIILPNTDKDEAYVTAQKICDIVAGKKFKLANDREEHVTISLGVSTYPFDGEDAPKMIEAADKRLYEAKNNGRNQVK